jgi:sortase A
VNAVSNYQVSPDMPRYLKIDKLSLFARIKRVGVDAQNAIEAPKNVYDAGWYDGSAKPGEPGAVFIDGHVSGPTRGGIFVNLKKLKNGDSVKVEMGNGTKYTYRVVATERVPKDQVDMAKALRPYEQGKQGLNIMTCAGTYDKNSETYDFRYIVYTVREG